MHVKCYKNQLQILYCYIVVHVSGMDRHRYNILLQGTVRRHVYAHSVGVRLLVPNSSNF
jgi:hypothetical protein